jgi:hypothetical protein
MLSSLEKIRKSGQAHRIMHEIKVDREGCTRKGHWRHYKDHSVWIEAHDVVGHQITRTR